jgi:ATP-binding cassette subfamily B protein
MTDKTAQTTQPQKTGFLRLLELSGGYKKQLAAAGIFSVLAAAARLAPFFTIYGVIDEILRHIGNLSEVNTGWIYTLIAATFAAALINAVCEYASTLIAHRAAYNTLYGIRIQLMEKLARIPAGFFTRTSQGALKKVISDDVESIEGFIAHHIADAAEAISLPLLTLLYLFFMDWRLALATVAPLVIAVLLLAFGMMDPKIYETTKATHTTRERMNGTIVEYVHGMPVVKIFNRTLAAFRRFDGDVTQYTETVKQATRLSAPMMSGYFTAMGAQLLFILPAALLLASSATSYLDFLPMILLFFLVGTGLKQPLENMMALTMSSHEISAGIAGIDRILSEPEIETRPNASAQIPTRYDVSFEDVSFSYSGDETRALHQVSCNLEAGSVTGLVGPSGGGKSTLAQLLLRFYEPQQGSIRIGGVDIRDIAPGKLMELVSYVFQDAALFHDTVEGNIRMGNRDVTHEQVVAAAKAASIHEVIMALPHGYDTMIGEDDAYLSGGEKQRLSIARVFLKDAPIVVLDEATAYADAENESKIQASFARLSENKTVLIIAHRLKTIERARRILVLKEGNLLDSGRHDELLERCEVYRDMVSANERRDRWTIGSETQQMVSGRWAIGEKA